MTVEMLPDWVTSMPANPAIHNEPSRVGGPLTTPLTMQSLGNFFDQLIRKFIGQIAIAFGGIEIFGWHPFEFLADWGNGLVTGQATHGSMFDGLASIFGLGSGSDWLGLGAGDGTSIWYTVFDALVPDWLEDLVFGNENSEFPMTFPHNFGVPPNLVSQIFWIFRQFTGIDSFDDLFHIDIFDVITHFITALLHPQDLLAHLVNGILPDFQAPQIIHDVIAAIVNAFRSIPIIGPGIADLIDTILDMVGFSDDAQASATNANNEIITIKAGLNAVAVTGGISVVDDFDRGPIPNLGTDYTQFYQGSGAGTEGCDGTGYSHWAASGATARQVFNRRNTVLSTKTQYNSFVLKTAVATPFGTGSNAARTLVLRSNADGSTCILFTIFPSSVNLTAYVAGTAHALQSASPAMKSGDVWEMFAGFTGNDHRYVVKLNTKSVIDFVDTNAYGVLTNFYHGYGATAGVGLGPFLFYTQYPPPDVGAYSAADRTG
jgi:hypothetical protein